MRAAAAVLGSLIGLSARRCHTIIACCAASLIMAGEASGDRPRRFGSNVAPAKAGAPGEYSLGGGTWRVWDDPTSFDGTLSDIGSPDGMPAELCVRVANASHQLEQRESGNCWPITDVR